MKLIQAIIIAGFLASPASAGGVIERACNKSDRSAATRIACSCIQKVANIKLSRSDQKTAAKFFKDPHLAQETRQSDSRAKEKFWKRYKQWGELATVHCSKRT